MKILGKTRTLVLLIFLLIAPSTAEIISTKLRYSSRHMTELSEFNFTHTGYVSVAVSSVWVSSADRSRIGFVLLPRDVRMQHWSEFVTGRKCLFDSKSILVISTLQDLSHSLNKSYPVKYPGMNSLYLVNCNQNSFVTMDVRSEIYNTDDDGHGTTKDYLSAGLTQLPSFYFIFSLGYLCFLGFWIFVCFKNRQSLHRTHVLMGVLLFMTALHLICAAADRHYVKATGTPHGWDVFFYMSKLIRDVFFFIVIVFIGAGWRIWKSGFESTDKLILNAVIVFQVLGNLCNIMRGEISHYRDNWGNWNLDMLDILFMDFCSCVVIFIPMDWSIILLKRARETDGNAAKNLTKLYQFVMLTIGYVVFTRIIVSGLLARQLVDKWPWVIDAAKETATLVFCLGMFYMYRPFQKDVTVDEEIGLVSCST